MHFIRILLLPLFVVTFLFGGMFHFIGGGGGTTSCESTTVENIDGAESDAYMKYDKEEHCRDYKFNTQVDGYISVEYNATDDSNLTVGDSSVAKYKQDFLFFKFV